jgi:hypothetical protein
VRRYSSADPPEPLVEGRNTPDYWIRPHRELAATAGLHRFVWDVHHERPAVNNFSYPISATPHNTPRVPVGSWALPGTYTVRLTVDGRTLTEPLTVKMDPRVTAPPQDIKVQYDTSRAIDALLRRSQAALGEIRKLPNRTPAITDVEQRLTRSSQPLGQLFNTVEQTDAAPTPVAIAAWRSASAAVEAALTEWEKLRGR